MNKGDIVKFKFGKDILSGPIIEVKGDSVLVSVLVKVDPPINDKYISVDVKKQDVLK